MAAAFDYGAYAAMRDDLGSRYMQQLRTLPRGHVLAWQAIGCLAAADAFAIGVAEWKKPNGEPRAFGLNGSAGNGHAYTKDATYHHRAAPYL